jgi:hypothetical protein
MIQTILAAILSLGVAWTPPGETPPESNSERRQRLETVARAVELEVPTRQWRAVVIALLWHESRFARDVHSGARMGDAGRAACLGQLHRLGLPRDEWEALTGVGLPATRRCVRVAYQRLRAAQRWCRARHGDSSIAATLALYGSGRSCRAPWTAERVATYRRVLARI